MYVKKAKFLQVVNLRVAFAYNNWFAMVFDFIQSRLFRHELNFWI